VYRLFPLLLIIPLLAGETPEATSTTAAPLDRTWSVAAQGGFSSLFQLTLGGFFGEGVNGYNRLTAGVNDVWRKGDNLSMFGWSTTDVHLARPNWQAGAMYKMRVVSAKRHALSLGGGVQRWLLPTVKTGAKDWLVAGSLNYATLIKRVPLVVMQDSWSLVSSTLPTGSVVFTQIYTQHPLVKAEGFQLALRQGPSHTHSWNFYGANGNRVVRYGASLVAVWKGTTIEGGYRQQFGLQDGIRWNRFWSFQVARQFGGSFHAR